MTDKVLFVDDDPQVLAVYARQLQKEYAISPALGAGKGLAALAAEGPFAVIISDINMPEMNGIEFLARARERSPDSVRMVLSGVEDLATAVEAINQGQIFRFLTKPCPAALLAKAVSDAVAQFHLIQAEKERVGLVKLREALEGIIQGFATLVEARDPYTAGHQRRVTRLATAIAGEMGLGKGRLEALRLAAMVHDLGKLTVPSEYLNKPGRLTDLEMSIIRTHPQTTREVLSQVNFHSPISEIAAQHHERLDGSGYPLGLKGEEVLLEARIMAVADVVEAMASHRPYRPSLGVETALKEITDRQGTWFDPLAVAACVKLIKEKKFRLED
jgi:putative nucleotidyltransferase with HDIG domain